jgi:hypothetical protein
VLGVVAVLGIVGIHALVERKPKWFDYTDSTTWELIKKEKKIMYQLSITAGGHSKIVNLDTKDEINQFVNTTNMVSDVKIVELDGSGARELTREEILDIVLL